MDTSADVAVSPSNGHRSDRGQYLTFLCGDEEYGVDILRVREIRGWPGVTAVPEAPAHVLGIMNLRGDIVPVVDLRSRFGLTRRAPDASTVLIVVSNRTKRGERMVGICVDAVSDVRGFPSEAVREPPDLGQIAAEGFVGGVVPHDAKLIQLLDIDRVVGDTGTSAAGGC